VTTPFLDDTVAAVATPPGRGAIALLRVSGPGAGDALRAVCPTLGRALPEPRVQRLLEVRSPVTGELLDRALVTWFPAPGSFTGEDTVEIASHGGALTPQLILDALLAAGARAALPGEFTRRAVLNGKMDLLQAEAILDLIDGNSRALHRAAIRQMDRALSNQVDSLRAAVLRVEALVSYGIDFPEEDEPPVPPEVIRAAARDALAGIDALLATTARGELLREGALVVLAGEPNSGKSSLFNALLGTNRAIVTDVPGTTRDAIEATLEIEDHPVRLVDTAGLRSTDDRVEGIGIEVSQRYLRAADLVLLCVPIHRSLDAVESRFLEGLPSDRILLVRTMSDLDGGTPREPGPGSDAAVSALTGAGIPALARLLVERSFGAMDAEQEAAPLVTRARHARALAHAGEEIRTFLDAFDDVLPPEFAATHLRAAAAALEDLVGAVTTDDVLGEIFSSFCVGK
jgi:tRNA modification GTPase